MIHVYRWLFVVGIALLIIAIARGSAHSQPSNATILACAKETIVVPRRNASPGELELYRQERYRIENCRMIVGGWTANPPYKSLK